MARTARTARTTARSAPFHVRQGDVLVTRIDRIPAGAARKPRDHGRVILAYGEVTGHAHAIDDTLESPAAALYEDPSGDGSFYLRVTDATGLVHEEHARIDLAPGDYRVTRQREYTPEAIIQVAD
jgi:hypothetical protein